MTDLKWSCDEKNRNGCRNTHGCHCREITYLLAQLDAKKENSREIGAALIGAVIARNSR